MLELLLVLFIVCSVAWLFLVDEVADYFEGKMGPDFVISPAQPSSPQAEAVASGYPSTYSLEPVDIILNVNNMGKRIRFPDTPMINKLIGWSRFSLDANYLGITILYLLFKDEKSSQEIVNLSGSPIALMLNPIKEGLDESAGGFRHYHTYRPTLYGTMCALKALKHYLQLDLNEGLLEDKRLNDLFGASIAPRIIDFVKACYHKELGGFGPYPGARPTSFDTDLALTILTNLKCEDEASKEKIDALLKCPDKIVRFLKDDCYKPYMTSHGYVGAFTTRPEDNIPCSSATRFAVRSLLKLQENLGREVITPDLKEKILGFLRECKSGAGFSNRPAYEGDLHHTDFALFVLKDLKATGLLQELITIDELLTFMNTFRKKLVSVSGMTLIGYSFLPDSEANLYSTRAAVSTLRTLGDLGYQAAKAELAAIKDEIASFVLHCYAENEGGFSGYLRSRVSPLVA